MKHNYLKYAALMFATPLVFTGCVDNNYDLSDIDTTTRIPVTDLTIPLNLKSILLDDVIDLSDNDNISVSEINGKKVYAIEQSGTIEYDNVSIDPVHVNAPSISSNSISLNASVPSMPAKRKETSNWAEQLTVKYNINDEMLSDFSFSTSGIDEALVSIGSLTTAQPIKLTILFTLPQSLANNVSKITFDNVKLQLPKGLYKRNGEAAAINLGTYTPATGIALLNTSVATNGNNTVKIELNADMLNAAEAGISIVNHAINYNNRTGLLAGGTIALTPKLDNVTLPTSFTLTGDYNLTSFDVATVTGDVNYNLKGLDIDPIDLSDLPDFLSDPETNIILKNPQIYLGVVNPTADYGTGLKGRMVLESVFNNGGVNQPVSPMFEIGYDRGAVRYNVALAADPNNLDLLEKYNNPTRYQYNGLTTLLSDPNGVDGLPKNIHVGLDNICFYGHATDFPIRQNDNSDFGIIPSANGDYTFYAPLAMDLGSTVVYAKTEDGIGTEDLDKVTVNRLKLSANAQTNLPYQIKIDLVVMNTQGEQVGKCTQGIVLNPNANEPISLVVESTPESTITDIDAIQYRARIVSTNDVEPLSPDQFIKLSNLRLTVDGYIQTDF